MCVSEFIALRQSPDRVWPALASNPARRRQRPQLHSMFATCTKHTTLVVIKSPVFYQICFSFKTPCETRCHERLVCIRCLKMGCDGQGRRLGGTYCACAGLNSASLTLTLANTRQTQPESFSRQQQAADPGPDNKRRHKLSPVCAHGGGPH